MSDLSRCNRCMRFVAVEICFLPVVTVLETAGCKGSSVKHYRFTTCLTALDQGRTEVRWRPGQETNLAPPFSNLRSFGRKCAVEESTCDIVVTFRHAPQ